MAPPPVLTLALAGCEAHLDFGDARIAERLIPWVRGFAGLEATTRGVVSFTWRVGGRRRHRSGADAAPGPIADYYHLTGAMEDGRVVYRTTDGGWMALAPAAGPHRLPISDAMLSRPGLVVARSLQRGPHVAAAATGAICRSTRPAWRKYGCGVLIVGAPMAGKTSLALNFVRRGWAWLSDDKIALESTADGVRMSGLYRPANVDPGLGRWFPGDGRTSKPAPAPSPTARSAR